MSTSAPKNLKVWADKSGEFKRQASVFRSPIEKGGKFPPEASRYHLYVSLACPWAHRTLIARKLKGLENLIDVTVVHWHMDNKGWRFKSASDKDTQNIDADPLYNFERLSQLYFKANPNYSGRYTVPTLWDKKTETIVNNESSEIIRFLNTAFNDFDDLTPEQKKLDFYPKNLQKPIDEVNDWIYDTINNGVYKSGFATTQEAYEKHVKILFEHLDKVEKLLEKSYHGAKNPERDGFYLVGDQLTEADIRLYTTLVRFDVVYVQHFKCNINTIRSGFPYTHKYLRYLYWKIPAFKDTTDFEHIKKHYTKSHTDINPHSITPVGPIPNILPFEVE